MTNKNKTQEEIDEQNNAMMEYIESSNKQIEETTRRI